MLNEYKEYLDYTVNLKPSYIKEEKKNSNTNYYGRLIHQTIKDTSGFKRILTIIARRFLFHDLEDISTVVTIDNKNKQQQIDRAKTALVQWASNEVVRSPLHEDLIGKGGFGKYYSYLNDLLGILLEEIKTTNKKTSTIQDKYNVIDKAIINWREYVDNTLSKDFYSTDKNQSIRSKFNNRIMTFDIIIASALDEGPLKNRSVYIPHNSIKKIISIFESTHRSPINVFIFMSALYAVKYQFNNQTYQAIELIDISNWIGNGKVKSQHNDFNNQISSKAVYGTDLIQNVVNKVTFSIDLIENYEIISLTYNESIEEKDDYFLVSDDKDMKQLLKEIKKVYNKLHKKVYPKKKKPKKTQK